MDTILNILKSFGLTFVIGLIFWVIIYLKRMIFHPKRKIYITKIKLDEIPAFNYDELKTICFEVIHPKNIISNFVFKMLDTYKAKILKDKSHIIIKDSYNNLYKLPYDAKIVELKSCPKKDYSGYFDVLDIVIGSNIDEN